MKPTLFTTRAAAFAVGIHPHSFARWARRHGITPVRRQRIHRSYVTLWSREDLLRATRKAEGLAE